MAEPDLHSVALPRLDQAHLAALEKCPRTKLGKFRAGEKLFEAGQCDGKFYVIKSGEVEIIDDSGDR